MDLQKYKQLIDAFLTWYNTLEMVENPYEGQLTSETLNALDKDSFIQFFYDFYAESGQVHSGGHRTKNRFRETLVNDYVVFRAYLLKPFEPGFNVVDWLEERKKFNQWGEGISTIYLNRINRDEYPVINNKTLDGLKLLGFTIGNSYPFKYEDVRNAQRLLMREFPGLRNFFVTDRLNQYVVGETEGQQMIREINPGLLEEIQRDSADPLKTLITGYKKQLGEQGFGEERYKWKAVKHFQEKWDPDGASFGEMFADAISLQQNLIDFRSFNVIMLFCKDYPGELKTMMMSLYSEEDPLPARMKDFQAKAKELIQLSGKNMKDTQDERAISLYLFFRYPDKYIHYKNSFYTALSKLSGTPKEKAGDKYIHFQHIASEFKNKFVIPDEELIEQARSNLTPDLYQDPSYNLLTQDILYFLEQNAAPDKPGINYWIFQGNPAFFDFETAFRDNLVDSWTVSAHRDKIKAGDKAIIWLTGENAGCYALAVVTGTATERAPAADDNLWKTDDKSQWQVGIKLTKNLFHCPILWNEIQMDANFEKLQVGNRGTNFTATQDQYEAFENIANAEDVDFMQTLKAFPRKEVQDFYAVMSKIIKKFGLKYGDQRVIYNTRKDRISFTVGQRYAFNYFNSDKNGKFGFMSDQKINENDGSFSGNPAAYYVYCENIEFLSSHEYSFFNAVQNELARTSKTGLSRFNNAQFEQSLFEYANQGTFMGISNDSLQLNQILFGPPGTGKTFNTINKALEIMGESTEGLSRNEIKNRFDKLTEEGRIMFTTFHQSMSYEDFIEGIKPVEPEKEGDPLIYYIEYGILRKLCIDAAFEVGQLRASTTTADVLDFSVTYDRFVENLEERLSKAGEVSLATKNGGAVLVDSISLKGNIIIKHHNGQRTYTVSKPRLTKLQSAIPDLKDISNIDDQFRTIIGGSNSSAYWSVLNAIRKEGPKNSNTGAPRTYTWDEKKEVVMSLLKKDYQGKNARPYVLIIDEINRGNVSQVFGEIITLIEKDKRLGNDEALEVTLPYSKEKFGIPPNLYIIGTMNTADRSVEALDTALRRRFSFVEMAPRYDLEQLQKEIIGAISLSGLLEQINRRIEKLLDKDHMIGHSYFLCVKDVRGLKQVFRNNIIPLLQEYFYGDIGKIALVLDTGFFERPEINSNNRILARVDWYEHGEDLEERVVVHLKNIDRMDEAEFVSAIRKLMNKPAEDASTE